MSKFPLNEGGGKGDKPRPVDKKKYDETWERCFGKKQEKQLEFPFVEEMQKQEDHSQPEDPKDKEKPV